MSKNLYQRMSAVMMEVESVFKGANVNMGNGRSYSAVNHDDVAALLHRPLAQNGIITKVSVEKVDISTREKTNKFGDVSLEYRADVWVEVTFINADNPEERELCKSFAYAFDSGDKAVGKAESMAVKYVFLKNFVLESTDNEESRDHEINHKAAPAKAPAKPSLVEEIKAKETAAPNTGKKTVSFAKKVTPPAPTTDKGVTTDIEM